MMFWRFLIVLGISSAVVDDAQANELNKALVCTFGSTLDLGNGRSSPTTGESVWVLTYQDNKLTQVKSPFYCDAETAVVHVDDRDIRMSCSQNLQNLVVERTGTINRYSGAYEETWIPAGDQGGLIHYGRCVERLQQF